MPRQTSQTSRPSHLEVSPPEDEIFRTLIVDHSIHPHHYGTLADANRTGEAENPVCGDRYRVFLKVAEARIEAIRFTGTGCSLSMASASMMVDVARHMRLREIHSLIDRYYGLFTGETSVAIDDPLGDLHALAGVRGNPFRITCAKLPWYALKMALGSDTD